MPRTCTICRHAKRDAIDRALIERHPFRSIADQYAVSKSALIRHHDDHIPAGLAKARNATEVANADDLLAQVRDLRDRALGILQKAESTDNLRAAVAAIREARGCLELLARLAGELRDGQTVNILISAEWREVRSAVADALAPFPEARVSVSAALARLDGDAGA